MLYMRCRLCLRGSPPQQLMVVEDKSDHFYRLAWKGDGISTSQALADCWGATVCPFVLPQSIRSIYALQACFFRVSLSGRLFVRLYLIDA